MSNGPNPQNSGMSDKEWNDLSPGQAKAFNTVFKRLRDLQYKSDTSYDFLDPDKTGGLKDALTTTTEQIQQVIESLKRLQNEGLGFSRDPGFQRGIRNVSIATDELIGSAEAGTRAYEELFKNLRGFGQMSSIVFEKGLTKYSGQTRDLTDALSVQSALLQQLGLGYRDFQKNIDSAIYSFGLNKKGVLDFNMQIKTLADDLKMLPAQVSTNFQLVSKNLAFDLGTIKDQFIKFQKLSLATGVDVSTVSSAFGSSMDTFQGASAAAANINMLLGRQAFSGSQLLTMKDADRANAVRKAIMGDDTIMRDIQEGGVKGKFALLAAAEALPGMNTDQVRRFLLTGDQKSVKEQVARATEAGITPASRESFKNAIDDYEGAIKQSTRQILRNVSDLQRAIILGRGETARMRRETGQPGFLAASGLVADLGFMPEGITREEGALAFQRGGGESFMRFLKRVQTPGIAQRFTIGDERTGAEVVKNITAGLISQRPEAQRAALARIESIISDQQFEKDIAAVYAELSAGAKSGFVALGSVSEFGQRLLMGELLPGGLLSTKALREKGQGKKLLADIEEIGKTKNLDSTNFKVLGNFKELLQRQAEAKKGTDASALKKFQDELREDKNRFIRDRLTRSKADDVLDSRVAAANAAVLREQRGQTPARVNLPAGVPGIPTQQRPTAAAAPKQEKVIQVVVTNSGPAIDKKDLKVTKREVSKIQAENAANAVVPE